MRFDFIRFVLDCSNCIEAHSFPVMRPKTKKERLISLKNKTLTKRMIAGTKTESTERGKRVAVVVEVDHVLDQQTDTVEGNF